LVIGM